MTRLYYYETVDSLMEIFRLDSATYILSMIINMCTCTVITCVAFWLERYLCSETHDKKAEIGVHSVHLRTTILDYFLTIFIFFSFKVLFLFPILSFFQITVNIFICFLNRILNFFIFQIKNWSFWFFLFFFLFKKKCPIYEHVN